MPVKEAAHDVERRMQVGGGVGRRHFVMADQPAQLLDVDLEG
ncbi:hypothetical protein [Streptomyces sp. NPDC000133]